MKKNKKNGKKTWDTAFDASHLRERIEEKGWKIPALSKKANISYTLLQYIRKGQRNLVKENLKILSEILDCSEDYLIGKSHDPRGGVYAFLADLDYNLHSEYDSILLYLSSIGIDIIYDKQTNKWYRRRNNQLIFIDSTVLYFMLDRAKKYMESMFDDFESSSLRVLGAADMGADGMGGSRPIPDYSGNIIM